MTVIHAEEFVELGVKEVIRKARDVVGDGPTCISFDIDGLDPVYAPGYRNARDRWFDNPRSTGVDPRPAGTESDRQRSGRNCTTI
jgi:hypothetical protein